MTNRKVLVIDDEKLLAKSTGLALRHYGFETSIALDGAAGIEAAKEFVPDIILLDIMMPGMDGWQVLEKLKQQDSTRGIPVIIFTAKEYSSGFSLAVTKGAVDYIAKPFDMEEMIAVMDKHIGIREKPMQQGSTV